MCVCARDREQEREKNCIEFASKMYNRIQFVGVFQESLVSPVDKCACVCPVRCHAEGGGEVLCGVALRGGSGW